MIDFYYWPTPNGWKISILLEELDLPYQVHWVNIAKGDQFEPEFLKISPNNKMPAIIDSDGPGGEPVSVFESGAILIYLAEKTGKLLPTDPRRRLATLEWLMVQMGGVGPMFGQYNHFNRYAPEKIGYAIDRYANETKRIYGVLDRRLTETGAYLAGPDYTIADIATWPWVLPEMQGIDIDAYPGLQAWWERVNERPAVQKGRALGSEKRTPRTGEMSEEERENLFGSRQVAGGRS